MKKGIHPENYRSVIFLDSSSGAKFLIGSAVETKEKATWEDGKEYPLDALPSHLVDADPDWSGCRAYRDMADYDPDFGDGVRGWDRIAVVDVRRRAVLRVAILRSDHGQDLAVLWAADCLRRTYPATTPSAHCATCAPHPASPSMTTPGSS